MPVSLSVKNVPDEIVARLKMRASRKHRSLQGELLSILEQAVRPGYPSASELRKRISLLGLKTPDEATSLVRELRNGK
ncbi:MAG: Arc family DNA-binding protein [Deltaproteobacteria bacterium]|nr:Arc family DNA-binding protein [Deltaproteobacteria bacterium]